MPKWGFNSSGALLERGRSTAMGEQTAYTPTWTTDGGATPSIGNGTLTGYYSMVGKTVYFYMRLIGGSTTNFGTGTWIFTLPVTAISGDILTATAKALDSGVAWYAGLTTYQNSTTSFYLIPGGNSTYPFTWGSGDSLWVQGFYWAA